MAALNAAAPKITDHLCDACREHFASVRAHLDALGVPYRLEPGLVRGLDYYTRTAFEFYVTGREGQQQAIGGGGRYDGLVELLGGRPTPGIGFGIGIDRLILALTETGADIPAEPAPVAVVVGADPDDTVARLRVATDLRGAGIAARAELGRRKLGKQLEAASRDQAHFAVIVGDELASGEVGSARPAGRHAEARPGRRPRARDRARACGAPARRRRRLTASADDRSLEFDLVADVDAVIADQRDLGLQASARVVDRTSAYRPDPKAASLVEAQGIDVVVGGHDPQRRASRRRGDTADGLDEHRPDPAPPFDGVQGQDLARAAIDDVRQEPDPHPTRRRNEHRMVEWRDQLTAARHSNRAH